MYNPNCCQRCTTCPHFKNKDTSNWKACLGDSLSDTQNACVDLIQSELAGLAFDSLQQVFRKSDVAIAMSLPPLSSPDTPTVFVVIDPAAGGPQSDYAIVSIIRHRGSITVSGI
jgi:hypothetical protein